MKPKIKLHSEEIAISEKLPQTSSNNQSEHKKYSISKIKNKIEFDSSKLLENKEKSNIKAKVILKDEIPKTTKIKKSLSLTYRYFKIETKNKNKSLRDKSLGIKSIKENNNLNSNFISLSKDANKYTSNAIYIKNKRMQLFDIIKTDNKNKTAFSEREKTSKINILYKTTFFRGGKFYNNKEKKKRLVRNVERNMSVENIVEFLEQNEDNLNFFDKTPKRKSLILEDNFQEKGKKRIFNNSLYKEIMNKKEEIVDSILNNKMNENQEVYKNNFNSSMNNSIIYLNKNNIDDNSNFYNTSNKSNCFNKTKSFSFLRKKEINGIPLIFPKILISTIDFKSKGEISRYQYLLNNFLRIKTLIENDKIFEKNNEYDYIKEFLESNNIDKKYIRPSNIINFSRFLSLKDLPIDVNKSLKENIILALNYNEAEEKKDNSYCFKEQALSSSPTKYLKRNKIIKTNINKYINNKGKKINIVPISKSLKLDLVRLKKLFGKEEKKTDIKLNRELKEELNEVEDEIKNKQEKIKDIENKLNLIPFSANYFNNKKIENKNNVKDNPIELRLVSLQDIRNSLGNNFKNIKKPNKVEDIFNSNERLYYSWFRDKRKGDINNFLRRTKLTEFVVYNKTKERILKDKLKGDFFKSDK